MSKRSLLLAAVVVTLAGCVPRTTPPTPAPPPPPAPPVERPAPPAPPPLAWEDAPISPGDWSYRAQGGATEAVFGAVGAPALVLRCDSSRRLSLVRGGAAAGGALNVRTTYGARALPASPGEGGLAAALSPADPLLDQMAFSRGRFAVDAPGTPLLIVPAWPEAARVVEDCRA
ncbi:hypothetical protein [Sphingosinicella terrae]|uniref:hypothetical protein n=1 Tax=Sphingosinicella terrae TaxID=2172047 RepID=UPI000E0CE726|nr:hypothetical protein [Sphingosinicella terrae]